MFFARIQGSPRSIPWSTRILFILGSIIMFSLLFFFAFTFFVIGLVAVGVALIAQFFLGKPDIPSEKQEFRVYRSKKQDDDVIDI